MTYAGNRIIFDADSHLMELPDFLSAHASADTLDILPNLKKSLTGQFNPDTHEGKKGHRPENVKRLLELGDNLTKVLSGMMLWELLMAKNVVKLWIS